MIIVGANAGETSFGKPLRDGGAAIIADGQLIYASAEERHTGVKASGGYNAALAAGMTALGLQRADKVFLSSCCEPILETSSHDEHEYVDHHKSHAALAYYGSGLSDALVVVCDAGGNVVERSPATRNWWMHQRQQLSIYSGRHGKLTELGSHFLEPMSCGLGEMYRAFTYFLGWNSGRQAGKVMALAGAGERLAGKPDAADFYSFSDGLPISKVSSFDPYNPSETARRFLRSVRRDDLIRAWENHGDDAARLEVAKIVQWNLETAISRIVKNWLAITGLSSVCFSGGVALNCTAVRRLEDELGCHVFVPPGSGDNGQSVGNAILGHLRIYGRAPDIASLPVFLGREYRPNLDQIRTLIRDSGVRARIRKFENRESLLETVAEGLFDGEVVFWFQGRGEFGARALGNRSILASPRPPLIGKRLNDLKRRETFNPFAASCLFEDKDRFFTGAENSPYMTKSFKVRPEVEHEIPAVVHDDGTCRAQIFTREFNPMFYDLLVAFKRKTDFGVLLNTSLNGSGRPIVETPADAINLFSTACEVSTLVINEFVIERM